MRRTEVIVQIHAWLEERELPGLEPAFRARLVCPLSAQARGAGSIAELHGVLDELLSEMFDEPRTITDAS